MLRPTIGMLKPPFGKRKKTMPYGTAVADKTTVLPSSYIKAPNKRTTTQQGILTPFCFRKINYKIRTTDSLLEKKPAIF